ncbi:two-component system LytT family response regulator [Aquimarina sp. EL_43]|uniref:LytR/AlgR family response regulator transcription factor n=1 Tax=unclassified Aquimarina TaxID=2627091 RepID=UPI0018C930B9|nr:MULTISPECIES: LytTR family DNA-binding domain-containing protein [unclassified Aquimarina]MBG6130967.1 two-component system LytT family response regulator [Aquimarina sp. EL_35]MBG6151426.1 two-component system LytT family response regulator [Aquimarina sp. EL_32]MBG6169357.1 two-component system LytT family response regulator [Aquimarina sp. EL_43]
MSNTAVIVEDSRLARNELKELLKKYPLVEIIGEAENVDQGYELITSTNPDILFLDINMPEKNGFDLLEMLDQVPLVVFTTAYDEYAIKSFEYNAFDYLLKPINEERFSKTIEKIQKTIEEKKTSESKEKLSETSQIFIKEGEKCWLVTISDIKLFEVVGNYTRVYFDQEAPLIYKSLNQIEQKLPVKTFFRASRQQIINLNFIEKVVPWFNGKLKVTMGSGLEIEISRRQSIKFREQLGL